MTSLPALWLLNGPPFPAAALPQTAVWIYGFLAFFLGCCLGSFLNVCIWRIPLGESVITAPSHCPKCGSHIAWYENVPLFSFLALRARCSHCHKPITWRYFIVELMTGIFFFICCLENVFFSEAMGLLVVDAAVLMLVIPAAFIDAEHGWIPDRLTAVWWLLGILCALPGSWRQGLYALVISVLAAALPALVAFAGNALSPKPVLGWGDVKLLGALGAWLGLAGAWSILAAGGLSAVLLGGSYLLFRRKPVLTARIALGPYLAAAAVAYLLLMRFCPLAWGRPLNCF